MRRAETGKTAVAVVHIEQSIVFLRHPGFWQVYLWRRLSSRQSLNVRSYLLHVSLATTLSRAVPCIYLLPAL